MTERGCSLRAMRCLPLHSNANSNANGADLRGVLREGDTLFQLSADWVQGNALAPRRAKCALGLPQSAIELLFDIDI